LSRTEGTNFNPHEALMKACIRQLSLIPVDLFGFNHYKEWLDSDKWYVERTEHMRFHQAHGNKYNDSHPFHRYSDEQVKFRWLDELDRVMTKFSYLQRYDHHWSNEDLVRLSPKGVQNVASPGIVLFPNFLTYATNLV